MLKWVMLHIFFLQVGECICRVQQENGTGLNAGPLIVGVSVVLWGYFGPLVTLEGNITAT